MGFTEKSDFQEGGSHENSIYTRKLPKRGGGAWWFADLRGELVKKRGCCFWGGWYPNADYVQPEEFFILVERKHTFKMLKWVIDDKNGHKR